MKMQQTSQWFCFLGESKECHHPSQFVFKRADEIGYGYLYPILATKRLT